MLLPPFWRGRDRRAPAGSRTARLQAVLRSAQRIPGYRDRLRDAHLSRPEDSGAVDDVDEALSRLRPLPFDQYRSCFAGRQPARRHAPMNWETRSALLLPYHEARTGLHNCHTDPASSADLYSPFGIAGATADLYRLTKALADPPGGEPREDNALVVFCGMEAGVLSDEQRDRLWDEFQVPLFEQFVGTDGTVVAAECEVHDGLHIRSDLAIVETIAEELVFTSLTDENCPALRVKSGLLGAVEIAVCECGSAEPRIVELRSAARPLRSSAVA